MKRIAALVAAAKQADWQQVVLNGGPPCFHVENSRFCLRAQGWDGHDGDHKFVSLADLIAALTASKKPAAKA